MIILKQLKRRLTRLRGICRNIEKKGLQYMIDHSIYYSHQRFKMLELIKQIENIELTMNDQKESIEAMTDCSKPY